MDIDRGRKPAIAELHDERAILPEAQNRMIRCDHFDHPPHASKETPRQPALDADSPGDTEPDIQ